MLVEFDTSLRSSCGVLQEIIVKLQAGLVNRTRYSATLAHYTA